MMNGAKFSVSALLLALVAGAAFASAPAQVLAQQDGVDPERAGVLEALMLAQSPLLAESDRSAILDRVGEVAS